MVISLQSEGDMRYIPDIVNANRVKFFSSLGLAREKVLGVELAHSRNVLFPEGNGNGASAADGILIKDPSYAASVTVADCMPIGIFDRSSRIFGVLHSGWKGTGILETAVRELGRRHCSPPQAISVILGPAIGACCYAVPEERARAYASEFGPESMIQRGGRFFLDLRAANVSLARRLGVGALLSVDACTSCDERLGSYRREGPGRFTRMVAVAAFLD